MEGLLQENGPALVRLLSPPASSSPQHLTFRHPQFPWNSTDVVKNPWSWTKLGNVMWVDQPVGTGFARGNRTAKTQEDVAADFAAFLVNYFAIFKEMQGKSACGGI
jgi:carboxypeptidase D